MRRLSRCLILLSFALLLSACGAGSSSGGDWYYTWNCNGDSECLATNPSGAATGTLDEGPVETNCTELEEFAEHFWGGASTDGCSQDQGGGGGNGNGGGSTPQTPTIASFSPTGTAPGNNITITGTNFPTVTTGVTVTIDGVRATVVSSTSTQIVVTLPSLPDFTGPISVSTSGGSITSSSSFSVVNHLYGVAASSSQFVAVGGTGTIETSPDGVTWTVQVSNTTVPLNAAAWSSSAAAFVVVGDSGTILRSTDGINWTHENISGNATSFYALTWTGSEFVTLGSSLAIFTSADGITWTFHQAPLGGSYTGVAWSGSEFVAVGQNGTIIGSPDGATWTQKSTSAPNGNTLAAVAWGDSLFAAVGNSETIVTSPDGTTWTAQTDDEVGDLAGVTWSGSQFVAVGFDSSVITSVILTSPDGVHWTSQAATAGDNRSLNAVVWGHSEFVSVGGFGTIVTSLNGTSWTHRAGT